MVKFARCNALISLALDSSGVGCRYVAKADTDQSVVDDMKQHLTKVHDVDGNDMVSNIKGAIKEH